VLRQAALQRLRSVTNHARTGTIGQIADIRISCPSGCSAGPEVLRYPYFLSQNGTTRKCLSLLKLIAKADELLAAKQQLELALATAKSSVTAQEQVVVSMLERLTAAPAEPNIAAAKDAKVDSRKVAKKPAVTGT
jgi:hypothetical protein